MFSRMSASRMRQDAFLPVEGVGLAPHVPGLQGAPLPEKMHDQPWLGVAPIDGMSCVHYMFCTSRSLRMVICQC